MNYGRFFLAQLRLSLRQVFPLVFLALSLVLAVLGASRSLNPPAQPLPAVALVLEDQGPLVDRLVQMLEREPGLALSYPDRQAAEKALLDNRLDAVFVITDRFSSQLARGSFSHIIERMTTPDSRHTALVTEPVVTATQSLWVEQELIRQMGKTLSDAGLPYPPALEAEHRQQMEALWQEGASIIIRPQLHVPTGQVRQPAQKPQGSAGGRALATGLGWLAALLVFYLLSEPAWHVDLGRQVIRERLWQKKTCLSQVFLSASLAPLVLALLSAALCLAVLVVWLPAIPIRALFLLLPMAVYLAGICGLVLVLARLIRHPQAFFYAAPLLTFVHGVLSGFFAPLPNWAWLLAHLSHLLPGRWLATVLHAASWSGLPGQAGDSPRLPLACAGLVACSLLWLAAGLVSHRARQPDC